MAIVTLQDAAPQELLKLISCKCKKGCNTACSSCKAGLICSVMCAFCQGKSCSNTLEVVELDEEDYEENLPIDIKRYNIIDQSIKYSEHYEPDPEYETDVEDIQDGTDDYLEQPVTSKRRKNSKKFKRNLSWLGMVD